MNRLSGSRAGMISVTRNIFERKIPAQKLSAGYGENKK